MLTTCRLGHRAPLSKWWVPLQLHPQAIQLLQLLALCQSCASLLRVRLGLGCVAVSRVDAEDYRAVNRCTWPQSFSWFSGPLTINDTILPWFVSPGRTQSRWSTPGVNRVTPFSWDCQAEWRAGWLCRQLVSASPLPFSNRDGCRERRG